jgi:hypothetical protein
MSSSIKKNRRSVSLTGAERKRREREKQRKNQADHASNAETQPRPIPLTATERKRRERASKRQNQLNDVEAQNGLVALSNTKCLRRHREFKRKKRVDFAYTCNTRQKIN